jgi:hypothetical protein
LLDIESTEPLSVSKNSANSNMLYQAKKTFGDVTTDVLSDVVGTTRAIVMPSMSEIDEED